MGELELSKADIDFFQKNGYLVVQDLIDSENKKKPLNDEKLSEKLKAVGYNVARRTVAKYREQLNYPVARLRREIK